MDKDLEELELAYIADGKVKWATISGKWFDSFLKTNIYPAIPILVIYY